MEFCWCIAWAAFSICCCTRPSKLYSACLFRPDNKFQTKPVLGSTGVFRSSGRFQKKRKLDSTCLCIRLVAFNKQIRFHWYILGSLVDFKVLLSINPKGSNLLVVVVKGNIGLCIEYTVNTRTLVPALLASGALFWKTIIQPVPVWLSSTTFLLQGCIYTHATTSPVCRTLTNAWRYYLVCVRI
jgi:hypothetical protein